MTEQEWLTCTDIRSLWQVVYQNASARKRGLFAVACCRRVWHLLNDESLKRSVEVAELFADDKATEEGLRKVWEEATQISLVPPWFALGRWGEAEESIPARFAIWASSPRIGMVFDFFCGHLNENSERLFNRPTIFRDIFGDPFRPVAFDAAWRTPTVTAVAQTIYDERRFADMPLLGDALEEAGCNSREMLDHCRKPGEHVRGCWVVDLALGKE